MPDAASRIQRTERFDLRALYETSQLLSASLDLEFVLNSLLLTAMSKMLVSRGVVLVYDPLGAGYRVKAVKGVGGLSAGDLVEMPVVSEARLLRDGDVPDALGTHRLVLVIPIRVGDRDIGVVGLGAKATRQPYDERELEFIRSLVNMSSTAVHNSLMVEELKQANRDLDSKIQELNTLFELSQEFNATIDRDRLVKLLSFALMGQMLVKKHLFLLRRRDAGEAAEEGPAFDVVTSRGVHDPELDADLVERLCGLDEMLLFQDEVPPEWARLRQRGLVLVLPLRQHGATCGALCLGAKMSGQPYEPGDVEFLSALGNLALVSIQNTYLVEEQIEKERLEEEMRLARQIQERLLPQQLPDFPGVDVAALALPSRFVGGDYFDVVLLEGQRLLLAVADVTGKGVPAALLMANLQASLHSLIPMPVNIDEAVGHINRVVCRNTDYDKFITYFHAIYHEADRRLEYVNAGHNPPMLVRPDGRVELLEEGGLLLGVLQDVAYARGRTVLGPGDVVALFTDGVTEAMSPEAEEYGEARLEACLKAHRGRPAREILDAVQADVQAFTGSTTLLSDDLTLIIMRVEGES